MKTVPLTIRRCPDDLHQRLKSLAKANRRSLNAEVLTLLEREQEQKPVTGREWAARLRKFKKMLTPQEHREFADKIEEGIKLMRRERLH